MKNFFVAGLILISSVAGFGIVNQNVDDRTMKNCIVNFTSNPFANSAPASVQTSCGYVYVNSHMKNGAINPGAITKMNEALTSGKPVDIKATGFIAAAYEITISE